MKKKERKKKRKEVERSRKRNRNKIIQIQIQIQSSKSTQPRFKTPSHTIPNQKQHIPYPKFSHHTKVQQRKKMIHQHRNQNNPNRQQVSSSCFAFSIADHITFFGNRHPTPSQPIRYRPFPPSFPDLQVFANIIHHHTFLILIKPSS